VNAKGVTVKRITFVFNSGGKVIIDVADDRVVDLMRLFNADVDIVVKEFATTMPEGLENLCIKTRFCEAMFINEISNVVVPTKKNLKILNG
jgi:hypothetical protein